MKILFLGDLDFDKNLMAFTKVGFEVFSEVKRKFESVHFYIYFQDGNIYTKFQKLFGSEIINNNIKRLGIIPLIYNFLKLRPNVIQITSQASYYLPILIIAKFLRIKILLHLHNIYKYTAQMDLELKGYNKFRAFAIEYFALKFSDKVFVLSEREKQMLLESYSSGKYEIVKVSNGINDISIKKDYNYEIAYPLKIVTVGAFNRLEKGLDFLIDTLSLLDFDVELSVCNNKIQSLPKSSIPNNIKIKLIPPQSEIDLRKEFVNNDLFIALSRYDSFNIALFEAMNSGMIFIASDRIGSTERFTKNLQNIVVPLGNKKFICSKIIEVINYSPEQRAELSLQLISFSRSFTWKKVAADYISLYEALNSNNNYQRKNI